MRDLALLMIFLGLLVPSFFLPHVGVLTWAWIAFMNPHRETYGFAYDQPFNKMVAIATIVAWLISREPKRIPMNSTVLVVGLFALWTTLTTATALVPGHSWDLWQRNLTTVALVFVIVSVMQNRVRLHALIWVIVISIGFYGVKGGAFTIITGGQYKVLGPADTMIGDNNVVALAMVLVLPLINYLRLHTEEKWIRLALMGAGGLTIIAVIGTYSRGGLVALAALILFFILKSKEKFKFLILLPLLLIPAIFFMPEKWFGRAETISEYEEDRSFQSRIDAWTASFNLAKARPLVGGGFSAIENRRIFMAYNPSAVYTQDRGRAAHSIYFQVLGDHGFVGFGLFMMVALIGWLNARWIIARTKGREDLVWARDLSSMIQVSLFVFFVAGGALSLAYYDVYFALLAVLANLRMLVTQTVKAEAKASRSRSPMLRPRVAPAHRRKPIGPG
ncbi:putative O-glycosylation ligase, exosortase A system-associated [Rhodospirillaceae bacterium SYSU D60014]|uniref:putative O-glycosylation ligase, exosortase A system-associated n=1 Tax=Virgifigura deserti TaxID=2268457 RepID=UPI000E66BE54